MAKLVDVRDMGENYGVGTYTLQSVRAGDVLMEEAPIVFTQSLASQGGPVGVRCCRGCGMIITTLADECRRLLSLRHTTLQKLHCANNDNNDNSGGGDAAGEDIDDYSKCKDSKNVETISFHALYETLKEFSASRFFCHGLSIKSDEVSSPCGDSMACAVRFCSEECRDRYLNGRGGRFLLVVETTSEDEPGSASETMAIMPCDLRKPSAQTIMRFASSLDAATLEMTWLSKAQILRTLDYLIENFNERLLLIMSLFARCLNDTFADTSISLEQLQSHFTEKLHELVSRFAEGAARPLTKQQRAFLRFSWKCVCRWLDLCCLSEKGVRGGAEPFLWLPLQLYLRCFWLADANVHMFVVVSPVYSLLCQQLPTLQSIWQRKNDDKSGGSSSSRLSRQMNILRELFRVVDPSSAHATGVALYDATTKINHSCVPSVRFVPTHGRVRAVVVALRDIEEGEEIRTSYIDVSAHASRMERREYLLSHYGFDCDCPLCSQE